MYDVQDVSRVNLHWHLRSMCWQLLTVSTHHSIVKTAIPVYSLACCCTIIECDVNTCEWHSIQHVYSCSSHRVL